MKMPRPVQFPRVDSDSHVDRDLASWCARDDGEALKQASYWLVEVLVGDDFKSEPVKFTSCCEQRRRVKSRHSPHCS